MSTTIYKYPLHVVDQQTVKVPSGARLLDVQVQRGEPMLWALVTDGPTVEHIDIRIHGTGHEIDDASDYEYIGTFQLAGGALVFHAFCNRPKGER